MDVAITLTELQRDLLNEQINKIMGEIEPESQVFPPLAKEGSGSKPTIPEPIPGTFTWDEFDVTCMICDTIPHIPKLCSLCHTVYCDDCMIHSIKKKCDNKC